MSSNAKARLIFWLRMLGWILAGVAAPTITFAVKFGLFNVYTPETDSLGNVVQSTSVSLNGWGIVCCLLLGSYLMQILKEIVHANAGYSLTKQCYDGIVKTIPYVIAYGVCFFLNGVISQVMFCLAVLIVCRIVAIPLNPLPKWRYEKSGVENYSDLLSGLTELVKKLKKGDS